MHAMGRSIVVVTAVVAAGAVAVFLADIHRGHRVASVHRQRRTTEAFDPLAAAEAAERAWRVRESPQSAWNRASAREGLHVRAAALVAWNDVLRLESDPARRSEAAAHLRRLAAPSAAQRWASVRKGLESGRNIQETVVQFPQEARLYAEEELFASGTDRSLALATEIGEVLARTTGERLLIDSAAAIHNATAEGRRRLTYAHAIYAHGRLLFVAQEMGNAAAELRHAEVMFDQERSPFALRAALYAATAEYYVGRIDEAAASLTRTLVAAMARSDGYLTVCGQILWLRGLIEEGYGHHDAGLADYHRALSFFERAHEPENSLGVETVIAEAYRFIGQDRAEWSFEERALRTMESTGTSRRSHAALSDAAEAAAKRGRPLAALVFQNDLVAITRTKQDPVSLCDALIARSTYEALAGDRTAAECDLAEVRRTLSAIHDSDMRLRTLGNLRAAEATFWTAFDPARAAAAADAATAELTSLGNHSQTARLQLESGRALSRLRRNSDALKRWTDGIAECEQQRASLSLQEYRRTYFETCRALFDESISTLARSRRFSEALALAEQSRARGLRDVLDPSPQPAARLSSADIPVDVSVVEIAELPEAVVIWCIDAREIAGVIRQGNISILRSEIECLRSDACDSRRAAADLFDALLRPIAQRLKRRVVVVPEGDMYRIPFAALFDRERRRYVVEDHETSVAPSLSLLGRSEADGSLATGKIVLVNAAPDSLPGADREIRDLAHLYPQPTIVAGSACTRDNVIRCLQSGAMVHFAGHGLKPSDNSDPALVVAGGELLYPDDIARLPLCHMRLVVLGACSTAGGRASSEGPLSISRAFLAAGAQRVVATLWDIDDDSSRHILIDFHRSLRSGTAPSGALRQVQLDAVRNSRPVREWAAFEVIESQFWRKRRVQL